MSARAVLGGLALAGAVGLAALNVAGLVADPAPYAGVRDVAKRQDDLTAISFDEALDRLDRIDERLPVAERLKRITDIFAQRFVYYWPKAGTADPKTMHSFSENWFLALRQRIEAGLAARGLAKINLSRMERRQWRSALAKGVGICSQMSLAVGDYLETKGLPGKLLPLGGHVVAHTTIDGQDYVLDADYNVTFAVPQSAPATWGDLVNRAYGEAGYGGEILAKVTSIYANSRNKGPVEPSQYTKSWLRTLRISEFVKWAVPAFLAALGLHLLIRAATGTRGRPSALIVP